MRALLLMLLLAVQLQPPVHLEQLQVLAADLRTAADLVHAEALASDPRAPATDKIASLARRARRFELLVPAFRAEPALLVEDFQDLKKVYDEARHQVDRSASPEVALTFQWLEMLMAKMAMHFGDHSISQADFTPGAAIPPAEMQYSEEGLAGLAEQVYILANQIAVRSPAGAPALPAWRALTAGARDLEAGLENRMDRAELDRRFTQLEALWLEAFPAFFQLEPDERSRENLSLLLSNYVRLRAAYAQLYPR